MEFLFDELMKLARDNPELFEKHREHMLEELIHEADPDVQKTLRRLQFRIDMERRKSKTPTASCYILYEMMIDFFEKKYVPAINFCIKTKDEEIASLKNNKSADLLDFPKDKK